MQPSQRTQVFSVGPGKKGSDALPGATVDVRRCRSAGRRSFDPNGRRHDGTHGALVAVALPLGLLGCSGSASRHDGGPSDGSLPDAGALDTGVVAAGATPLPCDVEAVLAGHCRRGHSRRGHSRPPTNFAPMALVSWEDPQSPAPDNPSSPVWQIMPANITAMPPPMPPVPDAPLNAADTTTLLLWIDAGTPSGTPDAACPAP